MMTIESSAGRRNASFPFLQLVLLLKAVSKEPGGCDRPLGTGFVEIRRVVPSEKTFVGKEKSRKSDWQMWQNS